MRPLLAMAPGGARGSAVARRAVLAAFVVGARDPLVARRTVARPFVVDARRSGRRPPGSCSSVAPAVRWSLVAPLLVSLAAPSVWPSPAAPFALVNPRLVNPRLVNPRLANPRPITLSSFPRPPIV
jgi:hypothetical protein